MSYKCILQSSLSQVSLRYFFLFHIDPSVVLPDSELGFVSTETLVEDETTLLLLLSVYIQNGVNKMTPSF